MRYSVSSLTAAALFLAGASALGDQPEKPTAIMSSTGDLEIGGKTLDQWIKAAKNPDPAVRENAVRMIGQFPEADKKKAVPTLITCLRDKDSGVCGSTIVTFQGITLDPVDIGEKEFKELVNGLVWNLHQGTMYARVQGAYCLGNIGPLAKDAIAALVGEFNQAKSTNFSAWEVRKACAFALGRVGYNANPKEGPDMRAVALLLNALNNDICGDVRLQALSSLDTLGLPKNENDVGQMKRTLLLVTKNERNKVIQIWTHVLLIRLESQGGLKNREILKHVDYITAELQKDVDPQNRGHAAAALGRIGADAKGRVPLLIATLKDPQPAVAGAAIGALGLLKDYMEEKDIRMIIKYTDPMESPEIRAFAVQTVGVVGAKSRIPFLIEMLKDPDELAANAATGALAQMKDALAKPQIDAIAQMLRDKDAKLGTRCRAAGALGAIGQKSQIPVLVEALRDKDSFVASSAVAALAAMKDQLAAADVAPIKHLAFDKDKPVETRCHAITLLGMLGGKAKIHVPDLIALLKDKDTPIVFCSIMALARMGKDAQAAIPELTELKKNHRETSVREAAAKAIEEINKQDTKKQDTKAAAK